MKHAFHGALVLKGGCCNASSVADPKRPRGLSRAVSWLVGGAQHPLGNPDDWKLDFGDDDDVLEGCREQVPAAGAVVDSTTPWRWEGRPKGCLADTLDELDRMEAIRRPGGQTVLDDRDGSAQHPQAVTAVEHNAHGIPLAEVVAAHEATFAYWCPRHPDDPSHVATAHMRPIVPSDRERIKAARQLLSERSITMRFFGGGLPTADHHLEYLTDLDYRKHFAMILEIRQADGHWAGVAVARYVCLPSDSETAEVAITVIDAAQGLHLAHLLFWILATAAYAKGIKRFCFVHRKDNLPGQKMMEAAMRRGLNVESRGADSDGNPTYELVLPLVTPGDLVLRSVKESDLQQLKFAAEGRSPICPHCGSDRRE